MNIYLPIPIKDRLIVIEREREKRHKSCQD